MVQAMQQPHYEKTSASVLRTRPNLLRSWDVLYPMGKITREGKRVELVKLHPYDV